MEIAHKHLLEVLEGAGGEKQPLTETDFFNVTFLESLSDQPGDQKVTLKNHDDFLAFHRSPRS